MTRDHQRPARAPRRRVDGVLLLDKPHGLSSNAALQRVKRAYAAERAGHTGTLDPLATGLLPICLGDATKFSGELLQADKRYTASVLLGITTSTADAEGEVLERRPVEVTGEQLQRAVQRFRGPIKQVPPMYSALKRGGQPLYRLARAGQSVERAPRQVVVHELTVLDFDPPRLELDVLCSKGTYIRTLAEDLGRELACGAHLAGLRRTAIGAHGLDAAIELTKLEALPRDEADRLLRPVDALLSGWPQVDLDDDAARRFSHGQAVRCPLPAHLPSGQGLRVYAPGPVFLGVGDAVEGNTVQPRRLVNSGGVAASRD